MKVAVFGLWHLGSVTAACLADAGFSVIGLEDDPAAAQGLARGIPPLFEPGLEALLRSGLESGRLSFTTDPQGVAEADVVWVTFDTPVDEEDRADVAAVVERICSLFRHLRDRAVLLVSSQLPVGTMADIERRFAAVANGRSVTFACSPENLRLGKAIQVFRQPERVIIGVRTEDGKPVLSKLFAPFSNNIIWVGVEAAELSKHAINAFLATCVTFINEIATVCESVGADAREVERALRSEPRIGQNAYIRPGAAFAGGTLARDVRFLCAIAKRHNLPLSMIGSILASNDFHRGWPLRKLKETLGGLDGFRVVLLGLSYKAGTDATRRSLAVELGEQLIAAGAKVIAFDPAVKSLPDTRVTVASSLSEALSNADATVLMTEWPDFKSIKAEDLIQQMKAPNILDQNGFLGHLANDPHINYLTIGQPSS